MKLVQHIKLHFQNDKSDKVYEVDLCEVGTNQYLVNFRYGKKGSVLRSGTKTTFPVEFEKAETVYNQLVSSKTKKGYQVVEKARGGLETETTPILEPVIEPVDESVYDEPFELKIEPEHLSNLLAALEKALAFHPKTSANLPPPPSSDTTNKTSEKSSSVWGIFKQITGLEKKDNESNAGNPINRSSEAPSNQRKPITKASRLVWRCGELRVVEALPLLLQIKTGQTPMLDYVLAWALGRIGTIDVIKPLNALVELGRRREDDALQVIARTGLSRNLPDSDKARFIQSILQTLPESWQIAIVDKARTSLVEAMNKALKQPKESYHLIADLYLLNEAHPICREAIKTWLNLAPVNGGGYFRSIRQLMKSAELLEDAELLGMLAYKVQKAKPNFQNSRWGYRYINGKYLQLSKEIVKTNSTIAFSAVSKEYFLNRFVRNLRRKGTAGDPDFVDLATGILLSYKDTDMEEAYSKDFWSYRQDESRRWISEKRTLHYPSHAKYRIFNYLLFSNSDRIEKDKAGKKWLFQAGKNLETPKSNVREEAFPTLWDRRPQGLLHLLVESECELVHEFATKAAKANSRRIQAVVDLDFAKLLLSKKYKATIDYGLDLVKAKYSNREPDASLVFLLLNHEHTPARTLGLDYLNQQKDFFLQQTEFLAELLFVIAPTAVAWTDHNLTAQSYTHDQSVAIIGRSIAQMMAHSEEATEAERQGILIAGEHLSKHFGEELSKVHFDLIQDLLQHPLSELQVFAGKILLNYQTPVNELPEDLLLSLINGDIPELRTVGIELLGKLPDNDLLEKNELLVGLCVSPHAEVRQNIYPVIVRLAKGKPAFGDQMVQQLAPYLLRKELHEGRDEDLIGVLTNDLKQHLSTIPLEITMNLLYSPRKAAHELGSHLLDHYVEPKDLTIRQIVRLGSNELVAVRKWVWKMYAENIDRIRFESREGVRLMDATWEDSRDFAFDFFRTHFKKEDWTADVLVSICDSVFPMVQQFGREMITEYFKEEDGEQYLLQLSEHPSASLQEFATNYLERFAENKPKRIEDLKPYFITVLSQVNKSAVAKQRIFEFLKKEGSKSEIVATIITEVLSRQSATMAIGDKTRCISIMRHLQTLYPVIAMPIQVIDYETYPTSSQTENA